MEKYQSLPNLNLNMENGKKSGSPQADIPMIIPLSQSIPSAPSNTSHMEMSSFERLSQLKR